jgi:extracellular elastinolytic metalloproteinase
MMSFPILPNRFSRSSWTLFAVRFGVISLLVGVDGLVARAATAQTENEGRNFDARVEYVRGLVTAPRQSQRERVDALRRRIPELSVTYDSITGVTRSLYNRAGYLTDPSRGANPLSLAVGFIFSNHDLLGLDQRDLAGEVTDSVFSKVSGATHLYIRQIYRSLPVYNTQLHVNVNRDGRILSVNNSWVPRIAQSVIRLTPRLSQSRAVSLAREHLGLSAAAESAGPERPGRLMLLPIRSGETRLVWNFQIVTPDSEHWYDFTVDAVTGRVWTRFDWVASDSYRVYAQPAESPNHVAPLPPADGRTLVVDPADPTASPLGWQDSGFHDFQRMEGNNVHAYLDRFDFNLPPFPEPSCGAGKNCDFPVALNIHPHHYTNAAVANLFYWNNLIHDVQYQYGFDEVGGNFQQNNFANGGSGFDAVRAEAQDGGGINNANMLTPPDGIPPRMQMYLWNQTSPLRDGDFDNGIIVHEYTHGISTRQVGGPSNSGCLNNNQQPGEGYSDWHALVYTAEIGDQGDDVRGIATYVLGEPTTGTGLRVLPYSTDQSVNNWTYASMAGMSIPHGVGSIWAQGMWEVYWALVDQYGFDPDLHDALGGAGNQRAMLYQNEGFKNTMCSPAFTDARDGILQAAADNFGGADVCLLWEAFAAYGLGENAISGGPNGTTPTNGFQVPAFCTPAREAAREQASKVVPD